MVNEVANNDDHTISGEILLLGYRARFFQFRRARTIIPKAKFTPVIPRPPSAARELPRSNDQVVLGDLSGRNESFARSFLTLTGTRSRERIAINPRHNFPVSGQQAPEFFHFECIAAPNEKECETGWRSPFEQSVDFAARRERSATRN